MLKTKRQRYVGKTESLLKALNTTEVTLHIIDVKEDEIIYANVHSLSSLGYSDSDLKQLGENRIQKITHPDDYPLLLKFIAQYKESPSANMARLEFRLISKDKEWHKVECIAQVLSRAANGDASTVLIFTRDITDQKNLAKEVKMHTDHRCRTCNKLLGREMLHNSEIIIKCVRCGEFNPISRPKQS